MSVNFSSINASSPVPLLQFPHCSKTGINIFVSFFITNALLLLPTSALVLHVGFQRWRRQRSTSNMTTSHTDHFTYHMVVMEIFSVVGSCVFCCGILLKKKWVRLIGYYAFTVILSGESLLHAVTCVERYLAVVHPVTYMSLKHKGGVRIRNISIGFVWLTCVGWVGLLRISFITIPLFAVFTFSLLVTSFCSLSVLRALKRPSPGGGSGDRERANQLKRRAFNTITVIMGTLLLRFAGLMVCMIATRTIKFVNGDNCVAYNSAFWFCLPSSLALPLLFLSRTGRLACCRHNAGSG